MKIDSAIQVQATASRAGVRRTVWILTAFAVGSYALFLLSVLGGK